jgi:hypothetical protein
MIVSLMTHQAMTVVGYLLTKTTSLQGVAFTSECGNVSAANLADPQPASLQGLLAAMKGFFTERAEGRFEAALVTQSVTQIAITHLFSGMPLS